MKNTTNEITENLKELLDKFSKKFSLNMINTINREMITEEDYKELGEFKVFYTISNIEYIDKAYFVNGNYFYQLKYTVIVENESKKQNDNLMDFSFFLNNETATNLFFKEELLKNNKEYNRKIRNFNVLSNQNYYFKNNIMFKNVITFDVIYEIELKGGYYKWQ